MSAGAEVVFDDVLVGEVVDRELLRRLASGDPSFQDAFARIYEGVPAASRPEAFRRVTRELFHRLQIAQALQSSLREYPHVERGVRRVFVRRAREEEFADILERENARDLVLELRPETLVDSNRLRDTLRTQFLYIADLLDPRFQYTRSCSFESFPPAQRRLAQARYRVLWSLSIDARHGRIDENRRREFDRLYGSLPEDVRSQILQALARVAYLTHPQLVALAANPKNLLAFAGVEGAGVQESPLPGAPCPLCGFPTFEWARSVPRVVAEAIARDCPGWVPSAGACARCVELYEVRV